MGKRLKLVRDPKEAANVLVETITKWEDVSAAAVFHLSGDRSHLVARAWDGKLALEICKLRVPTSILGLSLPPRGGDKIRRHNSLGPKFAGSNTIWQEAFDVSLQVWFEITLTKPAEIEHGDGTKEIPFGIVAFSIEENIDQRAIKQDQLDKIETLCQDYSSYIESFELREHSRAMNAVQLAFNRIDKELSAEIDGFEGEPEELAHLFGLLAESLAKITNASIVDISAQEGEAYIPIAQAGPLAGCAFDMALENELFYDTVTLSAVGSSHGTPQRLFGKYKGKLRDLLLSDERTAPLDKLRTRWASTVTHAGEVKAVLSVGSEDWDFLSHAWIEHVLLRSLEKIFLVIALIEYSSKVTEKRNKLHKKIENMNKEFSDFRTSALLEDLAKRYAHHSGNMITSLGRSVDQIRSWVERGRSGKFPDKAAVEVVGSTRAIVDYLHAYNTAKTASLDLSYAPIEELINTAVDFCKPIARDVGIRINFYQLPSKTHLKVPQAEMVQVFLNLVVNSIDAHREKARSLGRPNLSKQQRREPKSIDVKVTNFETKVSIKVSDNGIGIRPKNLPKIFDFGFTTKKKQGGSGIGLASVKDTIEGQLGGRILVDSEEHKGTEFVIEIPKNEFK